MNIEVNKKAPAFHEAELLVHASAYKVYKVLSSINDWPTWQSEVSKASIDGRAAAGKKFVWKAGGLKIKSEIHTANSPSELGWTGKIMWIKAVHNWQLKPERESTLVVVQESMEGFLAGMLQKTLADGLAKNLYELKLEAEKED
ncbi:SRPBCC family protein [Sunxiuqinia indica]|uniref:SRPBCC family protein n=1 Tax=Sunxiuqinia indica TaxID=2692584 RepID=UPI0013579542|nr:SRPBCC family protein [Sunxiuqinia indica]